MKPTPHFPPDRRSPWASAWGIALVTLLPVPAIADFSGADSLALESARWEPMHTSADKGRFIFQNSRLEYWARDTDIAEHRAKLRWTPNKGRSDQDWFVQTDVHFVNYRIEEGRRANLSIGILNSENYNQGYIASIDRGTKASRTSGFKTATIKGKSTQYSLSSASDATLRIHFDSKAGTLTGSWKTRGRWEYFAPFEISAWNMNPHGKFTAILMGQGNHEDESIHSAPSINSGDAYFRNFKCGTAAPNISVEQPAASKLTDGTAKRSFGTAGVGGKGVSKSFTIRNDGTAALRNLKLLKDGANAADFHIKDLAVTQLDPGASCVFKVIFKPQSPGISKASIHVRSNDPNENPFDIALGGHGVK